MSRPPSPAPPRCFTTAYEDPLARGRCRHASSMNFSHWSGGKWRTSDDGAPSRASLRSGSSATFAGRLLTSSCLKEAALVGGALHVLPFQPWFSGDHVRRVYPITKHFELNAARLCSAHSLLSPSLSRRRFGRPGQSVPPQHRTRGVEDRKLRISLKKRQVRDLPRPSALGTQPPPVRFSSTSPVSLELPLKQPVAAIPSISAHSLLS